MHTAPADKTCSHSGILGCGAARETTATTSGAPSEAPLLLGPGGFVQVGPVGEADLERKRACAFARLSLEDHEPPGRELAVIGHPRGDGEDRRQLVSGRTRPGHRRRRNRSAAFQERNRIVHGCLFRRKGWLLAEFRTAVNRPRSASMWRHEPPGTLERHRTAAPVFGNARRIETDVANSGGFGRALGADCARRRPDAGERFSQRRRANRPTPASEPPKRQQADPLRRRQAIRPGDAQPLGRPERRRRAAHGRSALAGLRRAG